jgi:hypothetical protein
MSDLRSELEQTIQKNLVEKRDFEGVPKLSKQIVDYREMDYRTARCGLCKFFNPVALCSIVEGEILPEWVCDAYQGGWDVHKSYEVDDWEAFVSGMVEAQPLQLRVRGGFITPLGRIIMLEDSMQPRPHRYSMYDGDFMVYTSQHNAWTQAEVNVLMGR